MPFSPYLSSSPLADHIMPLLQSWLDRQRQKNLDKRKIYSQELSWTIQLPARFTLRKRATAQKNYDKTAKMMGDPASGSIYKDGKTHPVFSCHYDKFNSLSGAIVRVHGFSLEEIQLSREDCMDRLARMFSRISNTSLERSSTNIRVGGMEFEQHTFLIRRNGRPIICFEYLCQTIGEYELSFSITYNNETHRQAMFKCLEESKFV